MFDDLIQAMVDNPILIERPIVKTDKGTVIGRPPENVLADIMCNLFKMYVNYTTWKYCTTYASIKTLLTRHMQV